MGDKSGIEWTDATWNPTVGCSVVSPGCTSCYAMRHAARLARMGLSRYEGLTIETKAGPVWTGEVRAAPVETIEMPLRWARPRRIFVDSMSDLFHPSVPDWLLFRVWRVMEATPWHIYQLLTKRPDRMLAWLASWSPSPFPNVWLGVSAEDQQRLDERCSPMRAIAALGYRTWCSAEPLLGAMDIKCGLGWIKWLVVGGESGPNARMVLPRWIEQLRQQCAQAAIPFFFKQWGAWQPRDHCDSEQGDLVRYIGLADCEGDGMRRVGKAKSGAMLHGRHWRQYPAEMGEK